MADKKKGDIVFRRIKGRIVPIRTSNSKALAAKKAAQTRKSRHEKAKAAGFIATGLAASVGGGLIGGGAFRKGVKGKQMAFNFGRGKKGFMGGGGMEGAMAGSQIFQKAKKRIKFGRKSIFTAQLVGGAFIGEGFTKLAEDAGFKESDAVKITSGAAGEVASFAVGAGVKKAIRGKPLRKSAAQAFGKIAKFAVRKKFKVSF